MYASPIQTTQPILPLPGAYRTSEDASEGSGVEHPVPADEDASEGSGVEHPTPADEEEEA